MTIVVFPCLWRAAVALCAAVGLEGMSGVPFLVGTMGLLVLMALEMGLGTWFRRHPFGDIRRVFALVLVRLSQPAVWALAAIGVLTA